MDALAEAGVESLRTGLSPLTEGYASWLDQRAAEIITLPEPLRPAADAAVFRASRAADRIRAGITLLTDPETPGHPDALRAFRFANRTMADQRRHTEIARLREDPSISYADAKATVDQRGAEAASWRPFQLAFVLLNLPSLTDPAHPERAARHDATVDLLFFPTGGGKPEAYLGLTAFTFAIRRLQGTVRHQAPGPPGSAPRRRHPTHPAVLRPRRRRHRVPVLPHQIQRGPADSHRRRGDLPLRPEPGDRHR